MRSIILLVFLLGLCGPALSRNQFNRPPSGGASGDYRDNPTYKADEAVEFAWETDLPFIDVVIMQKYPQPREAAYYTDYIVRNTSRLNYDWIAKMSIYGPPPPEGEKAIFWLIMYNASSPTGQVTDSHYFNVSRESMTTSSQSTSSQTMHPTSTISTAAASSTANTQGSGALSTGAIAGIAVGATLAGSLLICLCIFILWKQFQVKKNAVAAVNASSTDEKPPAKSTSESGQFSGSTQGPDYPQAQNFAPAIRSEVHATSLCEAP